MAFLNPLLLVLAFVAASGVAYLGLRLLAPTPLQERVHALAGAGAPMAAAGEEIGQRLARWLGPLARPSLPAGGWEQSPLRVRFSNAGYRSPYAPVIYFGCKTLLTFVLPGCLLAWLWLAGVEFQANAWMPALLLLAATGYYLPNAMLARLVKRRQRELFEAFPDALDLMRVCVEAGLSLDAAVERVGVEMRLESPALADEFHLVSLELRAGASRTDALRNLALRVAIDDVDSMVAVLVQADRFGTSIAESLRTHADGLRSRRKLLAEEKAAKLPVTLLFPLVCCIFPALLAVLLGPAVITVARQLLPQLAH
ncbi:MAG: type II secretion system F family protein [Burkholderiales bacterium]|nr:type II secretion system F family protein [Burkholderiales bacterium]